jgi:predicted dehydrogenase
VTQETVNYEVKKWNIAPEWLPVEYHQAFGAYLNTYSHVTNLLRYLFNDNPSVEFTNLLQNAGQLVVLGFHQFLATLETGKMSHRGWSEEIKITFSDGEMILCMPPALLRNVPATVEIYYAGTIQKKITPYINWSWAFRRQAEYFVNDILDNKLMRNSAEEGFKEIQLAEAIWKNEMHRIGVNII